MALTLGWLPLGGMSAEAKVDAGPFFERDQPFLHTTVSIPGDQPQTRNIAVRGMVVRLGERHALAFDQDLLRVAGMWELTDPDEPVVLATMAQLSYADPLRKASFELPKARGGVWVDTDMLPGAAMDEAGLSSDPRTGYGEREAGRGPLPEGLGRFEGTEIAGASTVITYRVGRAKVREWHTIAVAGTSSRWLRHFEVEASDHAVVLALGRDRRGDAADVLCNDPDVHLSRVEGRWIARIPPAPAIRRFTIAWSWGMVAPLTLPTPPRPASGKARWPETVEAGVIADVIAGNGLAFDRITLPEPNPWRRRVRPADLAFLEGNRAVVVTYDGDLWTVDGASESGAVPWRWRRFASGLHEPLAVAIVAGAIQVATKNGVVRLHDRNGDGEADWVENFNDHVIQSQSTRAYALDMAVGPDGTTYVTQGALPLPSTPHSGAILRIAPDGRRSEVLATGAREPFVAVHPRTGLVTGTDQQGNFIPSSPVYLFRSGDHFGFRQERPERLTAPLAWIPHDEDNSSASQVWVQGAGLAPLHDRLLHLSYGSGRLFIVSPDLDAPVPQAAVLPLGIETGLPVLHARSHAGGNALFLVGFQVFGARMADLGGMLRMRRTETPITTAVAAQSFAQGVVLEFASDLDRAAIGDATVSAQVWNYVRSPAYGSGRFGLDGAAGTTPWPVGRSTVSADGRRVFIHLPDLPVAHQVAVDYRFRLQSGAPAQGRAYFTINTRRAMDALAEGFGDLALDPRDAVVPTPEPASGPPVDGRRVAEAFGCLACHSLDGTTAGKPGPTWRGLYGSRRKLGDGDEQTVNEDYLRRRILDPQRDAKRGAAVEMPSYKGILSDQQIDGLIRYIRSLSNSSGQSAP